MAYPKSLLETLTEFSQKLIEYPHKEKKRKKDVGALKTINYQPLQEKLFFQIHMEYLQRQTYTGP